MVEDPPMEALGFVRAIMHYFSSGKYGRKIETDEFKELTYEDKLNLYDELVRVGYNVSPPMPPSS